MGAVASIDEVVSIVRERHNIDGAQGLEAFKPFEKEDNCGGPAVICLAETTIDGERKFIVGASRGQSPSVHREKG